MQTIAQALISDRQRIGLSQEDLAKKLGVSQQSVSKWETEGEQGAIPRIRQRLGLITIMGEDSATAQLLRASPVQILENPRIYELDAFPHQQAPVGHNNLSHTTHSRLRQKLTPELVQYCDKGIGSAFQFTLDYISRVTVAKIKNYVGNPSFEQKVYHALFQLALAHKVSNDDYQRRAYVLFITGVEPHSRLDFRQLKIEAGIMGVDVVVMETIEQVAKLLTEWERHFDKTGA